MLSAVNKKINSFFKEGHERSLMVKKNIFISFIVKGGSIIIGLILIPTTIDYVTPTHYGIWLTLSSIVGWINFFDLGLTLGLRNGLAEKLALNELKGVKTLVSTTYIILTGVSITIFLLFYFLSSFFDWNTLLNIPGSINQDIRPLILIVLACFCIQFVVRIVNDVLNAMQQTGPSSAILFFGQLAVLFVLLVLKQFVPGNLTVLVLIFSSVPVLVLLLASIYLYKQKLQLFSPNFLDIDFNYTKSIFSQGIIFFVVQITALIFFQTDNIIIAKILGPEAVTTFNISYKLFSSVIMVFTIIITPYWTAFTNAYVKNDLNWIRGSIKRMRIVWLALSLVTLVLFLASGPIYRLWIGNKVDVPLSLSLAMFFYVVIYMWQTLHVFLLNGINKLRLQLVVNVIFALANIPLGIVLGKKFGLAGVVTANTLEFVVMGIVFSIQCEKIMNNTATKIWNR